MKLYTNEEYKKIVKKASPNSPVILNCIKAFVVGGSICALGQVFLKIYMMIGATMSQGKTAVSVTLIFLSAVLTAFGLYDRIAKFAGAGTLVPITGFANAMVSPAMEFKSEGLVTGLGVKLFVISGPVLVYGISSSIVYGIIFYFIELFGR